MKKRAVFSTPKQLKEIARILAAYIRLPLMTDSIPGSVMEGVLAHVRGGEVLHTYDFVDVVKREARCGWQVKSTKASTPVTWKRAKIPNAEVLIAASKKSETGCQALGNAVIKFCNDHARASIEKYDLEEIGFSRLIVYGDGRADYCERLLCTRRNPQVFDSSQFRWHWSTQKKTRKKEQLRALHGIHIATDKKWFAWHGLGEDQLHFSGESNWWQRDGRAHTATFKFPREAERISLDEFVELLDRLVA